ncbi:MAG: zinc dependent phospholipase C family protein [Eubacterium sp.]
MPSLYAHNKFGKFVISKLPADMKAVIKKYPRSFRIGLQGPDFLFFYKAFSKNKINQIGVYYHHHDVFPFMEHAVDVIKEYGTDSSQYSYILGFICHFALDNGCHPYINAAMGQTGCGHVEIEGDLDQMILASEDFAPEYYPLHILVPADSATAESMSPFYESLTVNTIYSSLKWMKFIKRFFVAPGILKRSFIDLLMYATLHHKRLNGHVIQPTANRKCRKETKHLYKLLKHTVPDAVKLINSFNWALMGNSLSDEFHKDFNGNTFSTN